MSKRTLIRNVHLFDPANSHDGPGGVILYGGRIVADSEYLGATFEVEVIA